MIARRRLVGALFALLFAAPTFAFQPKIPPADVGHLVGRTVVVAGPSGIVRVQLTALLGHGMINETYRGHVIGGTEDVAVKLQRPASRQKGAGDSLAREDAVLRGAAAPQLVRTFGLGVVEGSAQRALVLELAQGRELSEQAWKRDWTTGNAVRVTMQILRGLRAMHNNGLRHNNLHLGNVMLVGRRPETLKVLDVGAASNRDAPLRGWLGATMAPERIGQTTLPSYGRVNADVYSAAAALTILLTGINIRNEPQAARAAIPNVTLTVVGRTLRLRDVLLRGLEPDPARRYQTAQELINALRPFSRLQ